jgi:hypothetical protein
MVYKARFQNGQVVIEGDQKPPEGAELRVEVVEADTTAEEPTRAQTPEEASLARVLLKYAGIAKDLPPDMARNHDHYIHGTRKR